MRETIDGHTYEVERDKNGKITRQEARDIIIAPDTANASIGANERTAVLGILEKEGNSVTLAEIATMLQFLIKRTSRGAI